MIAAEQRTQNLPIGAHKFPAAPVESRLMTFFRLLISTLTLWVAASMPVAAQDSADYVAKVGERVTEFEHAQANYRLQLDDAAYTYVNLTEQLPDASFAGIRFRPNAFSAVVSEVLDATASPADYAESVQAALADDLDSGQGSRFLGHKNLGKARVNGREFFQKAIYAERSSIPVTYVISVTVDGERGYQLLTFSTNESEAVLSEEAATLMAGFSVPDSQANRNIEAPGNTIRNFRSDVFGYHFKARASGWHNWSQLKKQSDGADVGALAARGYGTLVMPVCWRGSKPPDNAIYSMMMQQFDEDYPSDFIEHEEPIQKGAASGRLLVGTEQTEDGKQIYKQWIVATDRCAYMLSAWGPAGNKSTEQKIDRLWADFQVLDAASASSSIYDNDAQRKVNAYLLNALGLHFYEARSYRDAFRFFSNASELHEDRATYLTNTLRSLVEIDSYVEAKEFLAPRLANFPDNKVVKSWDAWLAYQTDDAEKALRLYRELFDTEYREDDDFSAFLTLLADAEQWDELDSRYAAYTAGGESEALRLLKIRNLSRRGRDDEALAALDKLSDGRPFNAELVYERIRILDKTENSVEVLRLAQSLIDNGYRSLQSYFYMGNAQYKMRSFPEARKSFEEALTFAPGNSTVREYLSAIDLMLGQGDVSTISTEIQAVPLPKGTDSVFAANDTQSATPGYGAEYLSRITGYAFAGDETRIQTVYQKIRIFDDNGISQFSTLEFDYDPSYETLFVNALRVRSADGELLGEGELSSYYITNNEDGYEASTEKTVHLPVPSLTKGSVIEVIVSTRTSVDDGSFPLETLYMSGDRPIHYSALFVSGETDKISYRSNAVPDPVKRGNALVWEVQSPPPFRWEPLQPYFDQILPWVHFGTTGSDWQTVGSEYLAKIDDKLDTEAVADRARRLVEGIDSRARRIEVLSAYVQDEIHYEAIEFGRRAYIPKTARETMRDRYGDCKDHAVLLYSMMQAVGIDASLALVNLEQSVIPGLPNTDQFNHMIISVDGDASRVFIDPTDKDLRLGQLAPRSMAGNYALLLGETSELVQIPEYESQLTGLNIERLVEPRDDGHIKVLETARFTGYQAAELRGQLRNIETSELQTSLQRWVANRYSDAELTEHFVENVFDANYDLVVEIGYTLPLDADGSFDVPGFLEAYYLEYDRMADRRFPFEFAYPLRVDATTSVKYPVERRLDVVSRKPDSGESRFGNWSRQVSEQDGHFKIRFNYVASEARFDAKDYKEFAEFQRKAVDAIEQPLLLQ